MESTNSLWLLIGDLKICPVSTSQMQTDLSSELDAICLPSEEESMDNTLFVRPLNGPEPISPILASQMQMDPSVELLVGNLMLGFMEN
jgi:hypothetical protein